MKQILVREGCAKVVRRELSSRNVTNGRDVTNDRDISNDSVGDIFGYSKLYGHKV